jgi:hypothetical protein
MENLSPREGRVRGVRWNKASRKWVGGVIHHGTNHHVGSFDNKEDAAYAVSVKRRELYTHEIGE